MFQKGTNEISLYQFFKMSRWGKITSTPTNVHPSVILKSEDYGLKASIMKKSAVAARRPLDCFVGQWFVLFFLSLAKG
jgi:hypothetical protein